MHTYMYTKTYVHKLTALKFSSALTKTSSFLSYMHAYICACMHTYMHAYTRTLNMHALPYGTQVLVRTY